MSDDLETRLSSVPRQQIERARSRLTPKQRVQSVEAANEKLTYALLEQKYGKDGADEVSALRHKLEKLRASLPVIKDEWFYRGAAATLSMFDIKSTEYHDAVCQHGGYWALARHAEEYDRHHLLSAAEHHEGKACAQRLRQKVTEAEQAGGTQ